MKLIIEQAALNKAIARATGVVESRNTIPILSNVLIEAADDEIWLTATDLNIETRVRVVGTIEAEGSVTAGANLLADIVRNAPGGAEISLEISSADPRMQVRFGRARYQTPVLPAMDFPRRKPPEGLAETTLAAGDLAAMLDRTAFAMANDEVRHYLNGVYIHRPDTAAAIVRVVATCTGRLASAQVPADPIDGAADGVIIPRKTVTEFIRALAGRVGDVVIAVSATEVMLNLGDQIIRSKIIDGAYVNYGLVVPLDDKLVIPFERQALLEAARRVALISTDRVRGVQMVAEDGVLTLQVRSLDAGQGVEQLDVTGDPRPRKLTFNAKYLLEALAQTAADNVAIRSNEAGGPVRLEPSDDDPEAGEALSILMPMAI